MFAALAFIGCILTYANAESFITLENVESCGATEHLPKEVKFGPCQSLIDGKCIVKYGDAGVHTAEFEDHGDHHNFNLQLSADIAGQLYERSIPADQYKITCTPAGSCSMIHNFKIVEQLPKGDHDVTFKLHCKDSAHDAFCYKVKVALGQ